MGAIVNGIGSLFGGGTNNNAGFVAKDATPQLQRPVDMQAIQNAQNATNQQLAAQQAAANQAGQAAQGAIGAGQTAIGNAGNAAANTLAQQQAIAGGAVGNQIGVGNQLGAQIGGGINNQNALAQALMQQSQGQGPNVAQNQLNTATGQNMAAQAAMMGSQRGAGGNVGMMGRQAAQAGGQLQQQAAGQAATLGAQQQLAAQGQLGNLAAQQIGQGLQGTQAGTNAALSQLGTVGQQALGLQSNALQGVNIGNNAYLQAQQNAIAGQNAGNNATLGNQQQLLNAMQGYNTQQVQNTASQNSANAGMAQTNANNAAGFLSKGLGAIGQGVAGLFYDGGEVEDHMDQMAEIYGYKNTPHPSVEHLDNMHWLVGQLRKKFAGGGEVEANPYIGSYNAIPNVSQVDTKEKAPKEKAPKANPLDSTATATDTTGGAASALKMGFAAQGGTVPGEPKIDEKNTPKNDTVPALLTPKEIVLPLSVTESENPAEAAKSFVAALMAKEGKGSSKEKDDFHKALSEAIKKRKK